jgi:hypothetical protein
LELIAEHDYLLRRQAIISKPECQHPVALHYNVWWITEKQ